MKTKERKLEDVLGAKFKVFENTLKIFLKEQEVTEEWEKNISSLSLKLCVWKSGDLGQSVCSPYGETPFLLSSSEINYLENSEDEEDKASYFYCQAREECTEPYCDRIHINRKIYYSADSKNKTFPGAFDALWIISCKKKIGAAQEFIIKVVLEFLQQCTNDLNIIEKADAFFWKEKADEYQFDIIKWYMKLVFEEGMLPDNKIITKIAWKNYENKENKSNLLFLGEEEKERCSKLDTGILLFKEGNYLEIGEGEKINITNIRKMLETCSKREGKDCYLLANNTMSHTLFGILTQDSFKKLNDLNNKYWLIEFMGSGDWILYKGKDLVLIYQRGEFFISQSQEKLSRNKLVAKIKQIPKDKKIIFSKILKRLKQQKYGALLIISSDAEKEAKILCSKFKRGTLIDKLDFSKESNLPLLDGIAAVDGAVLVDFSGNCYAFGVILDGDAKVEGDVSRGARYNSSLNYVAGKNRYAVIVSEDKENGIRIVNGEEKEVLSR